MPPADAVADHADPLGIDPKFPINQKVVSELKAQGLEATSIAMRVSR
jgi:hypothetical protein